MEIVKSYDSRMNDIWRVMDGLKTVAICYSEKEAEVCKVALEKYKADKRKKRATGGETLHLENVNKFLES